MTVLLDTCVLIDALRGRNGRREFLESLLEEDAELASCAVTVAEIYAGMRHSETAKTAQWLASTEFYETTEATAKLGGELKAACAKKGITVALPDALIAAVALENNLALATDDVKDFPMPELRLVPLPKAH